MKVFGYLIALVLLSMGPSSAWPQEQVLKETDYVAIKNKAFVVFESTSYRQIRTVEAREDSGSPWKPYSIATEEYIRPDRMHTWLMMLILGHHDTTEVIIIGNHLYSKASQDQPWRVQGTSPLPRLIYPKKDLNPPGSVVEYKQLSTEIFSGRRTTVVQKTSYSQKKVNGANVDASITEKYWFSEKGRILKMEWLTLNMPERPFKFFRTTTFFEYDPNIKIDAPIK